MMDKKELAGKIQFTDVNPDLTREGIVRHLEACMELGVQAAMISPCWVPLAKEMLQGTGIKIATTVNFPQATDTPEMKAAVIPLLARMGADEFDFPPNPALLLSGMQDAYAEEIALVVRVAHDHGLVVKAMLEFGYLKDRGMKIDAVRLSSQAGVDWAKNSSGWGKGGSPATVEDIALLKEYVIPPCRVKASGKVNSMVKALAILESGAELIGTSSAREILLGGEGSKDNY
ncbi:deoxyribose-phosphate aldolase [Sediminispirochaeta smaragdinae]|nr:deoxyribose-phosphate aldolase [Sediminispirochaeta smaragdinae]